MKRRILVLVAGFAALLPFVLLPTTASWTNDAHFTASASAGTWGPPPDSCRVMSAAGIDTGRPCTVTHDRSEFWGSSASGSGWARFKVNAPGIQNTEYIAFTVTVPAASVPAWWSWAATGVTGIGNGQVTSSCSTLPTVQGRLQANLGATPEIYFTLATPRPATGNLCSVP